MQAAKGTSPMDRVCVIGAGPSGIASCQVLHARGIPFDCYEMGSGVGGNWRYDNDSGMSSAYRSLHANSSRRTLQYTALPMPDSYPDYPGHELITEYLDNFTDHFGFRQEIHFLTEVTGVEAASAGGGWDVTVRRRHLGAAPVAAGADRTRRYSAVLVANGHHWDPRYPELPGASAFSGAQIHSRHYRTPDPFAGQRVLVLGLGNSACDIATECSRVAGRTLLAVRRGAHIVPKYLFGVPTDHLTLMRLAGLAPLALQSAAVALMVRVARGDVTRYGLPRPDHRILSAPPTVSDSLLSRLEHGDITVKPGIDRFDGDRVCFTDGSSEPVDVVIYCRATLPPQARMDREIAGYRAATFRRYGRRGRNAIQVDFLPYLREIRKERQAGAARGRAGAMAPGPRARRALRHVRAPSRA
jgi:thioredoxin reductase